MTDPEQQRRDDHEANTELLDADPAMTDPEQQRRDDHEANTELLDAELP